MKCGTTIPEGTTRDRYADALAMAMVMEVDWDFLRIYCDGDIETRWASYHRECRARMMATYGFAVWPFHEDEPGRPL